MKYFFKTFIGFCAVFIVWFGICLIQVYNYSNKYSEDKSDVALVLGAGSSNGKLSLVFVERMNHAINLIKDEKVDYILITGGFGDGQSISDSKAAKRYAISKGVEDYKILVEEKSKITSQNIKNAKEILIDSNLTSALVVSDPYHMKRAMKMCLDIGINAKPSPTPTTMYRTKKVKRRFLVIQSFNLVLSDK